jgi:hypothetical protein
MINLRSNGAKSEKLANQIDIRLKVLSEKVDGKHPDLDVPSSLTQVRKWIHDDLGIEQIGSPSSFVKTHNEHGSNVAKIAILLHTIRNKQKAPKKPKEQKLKELKAKNRILNESLTNVSNQFVKYSQDAKRLKEELLLSNSKVEGLTEDLEETSRALQIARDEVILLNQKLRQHSIKKTSKVTALEFGNGGKNAN